MMTFSSAEFALQSIVEQPIIRTATPCSSLVGASVNSCERIASGNRDQADRAFEQIIGGSSALEAVLEQVECVAPTDSTVLILGETGTGKELIAHAVHNASLR